MALLILIISEAEQVCKIYYIDYNRNDAVLIGIGVLYEELIVQFSCCCRMCFLLVVRLHLCNTDLPLLCLLLRFGDFGYQILRSRIS